MISLLGLTSLQWMMTTCQRVSQAPQEKYQASSTWCNHLSWLSETWISSRVSNSILTSRSHKTSPQAIHGAFQTAVKQTHHHTLWCLPNPTILCIPSLPSSCETLKTDNQQQSWWVKSTPRVKLIQFSSKSLMSFWHWDWQANLCQETWTKEWWC